MAPAGVFGDGEWEPEAPKKDDPEKVRGGGELRAGGESGQNTASEGCDSNSAQRGQGGGTGAGRDGLRGPQWHAAATHGLRHR